MYRYSSISEGAESGLMENNFYEVYSDVEKAIDYAFNGQFVLNFYDYLKIRGTKKIEVEEFIGSFTASEINNLVLDLDQYLEGGADEMHKQLREGYGHIPKPQARKIRNYLSGILEDAQRYNYDKRPGRRKKQTK
jgi:hypothetical protein